MSATSKPIWVLSIDPKDLEDCAMDDSAFVPGKICAVCSQEILEIDGWSSIEHTADCFCEADLCAKCFLENSDAHAKDCQKNSIQSKS